MGKVEGKLLEHQERVLRSYDELTLPDGGLCAYFRTIAINAGMEVHEVRRVTRSLARKGLTEYHSGLWSDDGEVAGAGYCISRQGKEFLNAL